VTAAWLLAFSAGVLAAFNPCGFALLPAYVVSFLDGRAGARGVVRAVAVSGWVTLGFVATFGTVGLAIGAVALRLGEWLSWLTMAMGVALVVVGVLTLVGRAPSVRIPRARLEVGSSPRGMVAYGVVYATVSLSCTLPVFLAAVVSAFSVTDGGSGLVVGIGALLAYALGMGSVLLVLGVVAALAGAGAASRARGFARYATAVSSAFVVAAGLYVVWYGYVELRSFRGEVVTTGPTVWVAEASAVVSTWLASVPWWLPLALAAVAVAGALWVRRRSARTAPSAPSAPSAPDPVPPAAAGPPARDITLEESR
jgi:cytochrome c-type biogenesis protein